MQSVINYVGLAIFVGTLAIGQVLFKQVGLTIRGYSISDSLFALLRQPTFYVALVLYGFATVLWVWILSRVTLMEAYPWIAGGMVIVPLLGWFVFGERVRPIFWVGVAFILFGIMLTQYAIKPEMKGLAVPEGSSSEDA